MTTLCLLLSLSVIVHDTQLAHAVVVVTPRGAASAYLEPEVTAPKPLDDLRAQHAHTDYNPLSQVLTKTFSYQSPSIAPRRESHHKQLLRIFKMSGRHAFDNANLPVLD